MIMSLVWLLASWSSAPFLWSLVQLSFVGSVVSTGKIQPFRNAHTFKLCISAQALHKSVLFSSIGHEKYYKTNKKRFLRDDKDFLTYVS